MNSTLRYLVLTVFCLLRYEIAVGVSTVFGEQWVYLYQANTTVTNNLSSDAVSQWSMNAKLVIQSYTNYTIMKFEEVKSTSYNGLSNPSQSLPNIQLPKGTNVLTEPFLVYYNNNFDKLIYLKFNSDEPEWSLNIKKAIASLYQVDFNKILQNEDSTKETNEELNIYGKCNVSYENLSNEEEVVSKKFEIDDCKIEESPRRTWSQTNLGYYKGHITRYYNRLNSDVIKSIKSKASFHYWMIHSDSVIQNIEQTQELKLFSSTILNESFDVSSYTIKKLPVYEFENPIRDSEPESQKAILKTWYNLYNQLKNEISYGVSKHLDEQQFNLIDKLKSNMANMDSKTLVLENFNKNTQMSNILSAMLPYIGTKPSMELIKYIVQNNSQVDLSELRLLALFPLYAKNPNEEMLKMMENLLDFDFNGVSEIVKQTYILSFSNLVYQTFYEKLEETDNRITAGNYYKNISQEYVGRYYKLFLDCTDYSKRMKYILGMMNMGESASTHLMTIAQNKSESRHIRALAIYSIKPELIYKKIGVYKYFWPMVKNASEAFEIRSAALSLLLSSNISSTELYTILSYMNEVSYDAARQHFHYYFYTAILSGKTDCSHCTVNLAQTMLKELRSPQTNQGLMTSYHQVSYTDENKNFETSFNVHVVANPVTNVINVFQVTVNHFTGQHQTGEFSIYIKAEGISNKLYKEEYERHYAIKELYKILQEMKLMPLEDLNEDLHIEIILYYEKRALLALYINKDNIEEMADYIDKIILYLGNNDLITMRNVRNLQFTSDVGTPIFVTLNYEHILGTEFKNYDKIFLNDDNKDDDDANYVLLRIRSMWMSKLNFESYNPLTNLKHGVSKIFSNQILMKFKMDYDVYELAIKMNDDSSYFDNLIDIKYAVFVDNDNVLQKYCSDCNPVIFISPKTTELQKEKDLWLWVKDIKYKETNCSNIRFDSIHEIIKESHVSYTGLPFAQPFVLIAYISDYLYYRPQYDVCSYSVNTRRIINEPNLSILKITFINDALDENYKLNLNFNITLALFQRGIKNKKIFNQWNLNVQRQEQDHGVYYGLFYSDNGKNFSLDIHSNLNYVPSSSDTDMFSLKPAEPITSRTSIQFKEKNLIPTTIDITSLFSISKEQIEMVNRSKTFELCQKDAEKDYFKEQLKHTPPTKSCYTASLGLATYDNYAIYMEFKNISEKFRDTLEEDILKPLKNIGRLDRIVIKNLTFNASVVYSALPSTININVGTDQIVSNYSVPELLKPRALLKPTRKLIEELRYNDFGLDNVCIIIPRHVITFTGKIVEHDTDTTIIPLIECTNTTRVGLTANRFTYKLWSDENTFQLGKKEGGYYVMRNGKYLKRNVRAEDYSVDFVNENAFQITTSRSELYYNGEYLTIKIKSAFINRMCGICVTGEITTPNMMEKYFN